jgi:hypothetical protein
MEGLSGTATFIIEIRGGKEESGSKMQESRQRTFFSA